MIRSTFKFPKRWQAVSAQVFDVLYPPACLVCGNELPEHGGSVMICDTCKPTPAHRMLPAHVRLTERDRDQMCRECGTFEQELDASYLCLPCRLHPMGATQVHSLWHYTGAVEGILKRYKYTWQPLLADYFAAELAAFAVERMPHRPWDMVAAVPSSPVAMRKRGFHHLGLIARKTAKLLGVPADVLAMRATNKQRSQAQLSPQERMKNAEDAFIAIPSRVDGQRVLLLDDVITSGESVRSASRVLYANGAVEVAVCSLARSVNFPVLRRAIATQPAKHSGGSIILSKATLFSLVALAATCCGCDGGKSEKLEQRVQALSADVQELQNLRKEVDYLRASMSRSAETFAPQHAAAVRDPEADQIGVPAEHIAADAGSSDAGSSDFGQGQAQIKSVKVEPPPTVPPETAAATTSVQAPITPAAFSTSGSNGQHMSDDPFLGKPDSEYLVMAFIDYQCGPCREFYSESFNGIKEEFVDSGKVALYLRDFPLVANSNSRNAASLAHCAGEQGAYWPMFDVLFQNPTAVDKGSFESLAKKLESIDQSKLQQCYASGRYTKELEQDIQDGIRLGARGAPGFFIGRKQADGNYSGVFVRGAQPFRVLRSEIKKVLSGRRKATV